MRETSHLAGSILTMGMLTSLNFTGNSLLMIPDTLTGLVALSELGLNDNRLSVVPSSVAELTNLTRLSLMDNILRQVTNEIDRSLDWI